MQSKQWTVLLGSVSACAALAGSLVLSGCGSNAGAGAPLPQSRVAGTGNGAPSGAHINLNLIGVKNKSADMAGNNGNRIFVPLWDTCKIWLTKGDTFEVLDANATDANGGSFQLPAPVTSEPVNGNYTTNYSVFCRALGGPGGHATMTSGAYYYDPTTGETVEKLSLDPLPLDSSTRPGKFTNVSKQLLFVYVDITDDGVNNPVRYPLFDEALEDYFWQYDNQGLKLVQLRFYPNVNTLVPVTGP